MDDYIPGDRESFERLYKKSHDVVLWTLYRILGSYQEAEGVTQDAFLKAWDHWPEWKPVAPAQSWILAIAKNAAISKIRANKIRTADWLVTRLGPPKMDSESPSLVAEDHELLTVVQTLRPEQAKTLILHFYYGYSNRMIAQLTHTPERTIASRKRTALIKLREKLQEVRA